MFVFYVVALEYITNFVSLEMLGELGVLLAKLGGLLGELRVLLGDQRAPELIRANG